MSGRPKKFEEQSIDMDSEKMLSEYESSSKSIAQIAAKYRISRSACMRRIERARRNRAEWRRTYEGQAEEMVRLRAENARLREILDGIKEVMR